jgi:hypothetical protein
MRAEPGQVLVWQAVGDLLLGSSIDMRPHRQQTFKDVPRHWEAGWRPGLCSLPPCLFAGLDGVELGVTGEHHRPVVLEGGLQRRLLESLGGQPRLVLVGPR